MYIFSLTNYKKKAAKYALKNKFSYFDIFDHMLVVHFVDYKIIHIRKDDFHQQD